MLQNQIVKLIKSNRVAKHNRSCVFRNTSNHSKYIKTSINNPTISTTVRSSISALQCSSSRSISLSSHQATSTNLVEETAQQREREDKFKSLRSFEPVGSDETEVALPTNVAAQFELVSSNPGNRHLKYDLVTLALRSLRIPLTEDFKRASTILKMIQEALKILIDSPKFMSQLRAHLDRQMSSMQRLDIQAKIGEHREKSLKTKWLHVPIMATYAHYLLLDAQLSLALDVVTRALHITNSKHYFELGTIMENQTKDYQAAAMLYRRSVMEYPHNTEALTNLAVLEFYHQIDTTVAQRQLKEEYEKTLVRDKGYNPPKKKNTAHLKHDFVQEAANLLTEAIRHDTSNENYIAHYHMAFILETKLNDNAKARMHYAKALAINEDHVESHTALGSLLMDENLYDKAQYHYQQARLLAPDKLLVYYNLANCFQKQGSIEAAVKEMQFAIRIDPTLPNSHYHLGIIYARSQLFQEAATSFERAIQLAEEYPQHEFDIAKPINSLIAIYRQQASTLIQEGETAKDFDVAAQFLTKSLDLMNDDSPEYTATMLANLAFCFMKANRPETAVDALKDCVVKGGDEFLEQYRHLKGDETNTNVYLQLEEHTKNLERIDYQLNFMQEYPKLYMEKLLESKPKKKKLKKKKSSKKIKTSKSIKTPAKDDHVKQTETIESLENENLVQEQHVEAAEVKAEDEEPEKLELSEEMKADLEALLSLKAKYHYNIAFCLFHMGELAEAGYNLSVAVKIDPKCTSDYVTHEEYDEGVQNDLEEALEEQEEYLDELDELEGDSEPNLDNEDGIEGQQTEEQNDLPREMLGSGKSKKLEKPSSTTKTKKPKIHKKLQQFTVEANQQRLLDFINSKPQNDQMSKQISVLKSTLNEMQTKYGKKDWSEFDKLIEDDKIKTGKKAIRSEKSKRKKKLRYTIEASKKWNREGPNDGFDSQL